MQNNQDGSKLPPLPASDEKSLEYNKPDSFYGYRPREFWKNNEINREEIKDFKKCDHFFFQKGREVECNKCHFIFLGLFEVRDGKLYEDNNPIGL